LNKAKIFIGFDQREACAYHTFVQSLINHSSIPLDITPLCLKSLAGYKELHRDGGNDFVYSRFLSPFLNNFDGWAIYADGDMVCQADILELLKLKDDSKAVMVAKHNYQTKQSKKYFNNKNENYPKKNWSSVILWNCSHPKHKILTPEFIQNQSGKFLHRFSWLDEDEIGEIPLEWNWLALEYPENKEAKIIHYTLGTPCLKEYKDTNMSDIWYDSYNKSQEGVEK
tara:strand:+ start:1989 stop:2666 length:678 start_codon:yes stop_codon:yes gene_type:complete